MGLGRRDWLGAMMFLEIIAKKIIPERFHGAVYRFYMYNVKGYCYGGRRFVCPCCNGHFRRLIPYESNLSYGERIGFPKEASQRKNALCPRCGSFGRHRLLWLYLQNRTNLFNGKLRVLHFAPEYIFHKKLSALSNLEYISVDLEMPLARIKIDITSIPFEDNYFDAVLCVHVLEHILDDKKAMLELFRVLKPGGWAVLQSPVDYSREVTFEDPAIISPSDRKQFFGQADHVRVYGRDYKNRLESVGFFVREEPYAKELGEGLAAHYCLEEDEMISVCTKPHS